ncbi:hypothetical protein ACA910_017541 [Epithemia clementina (nom. ined.)]
MQEYMEAQFQDHPLLSSEYVKFLAVNSGTETVKILEDKFQVLQDKQAVVMEQLKKATSKANSASIFVDSQKKNIEELPPAVRELKKIEMSPRVLTY